MVTVAENKEAVQAPRISPPVIQQIGKNKLLIIGQDDDCIRMIQWLVENGYKDDVVHQARQSFQFGASLFLIEFKREFK